MKTAPAQQTPRTRWCRRALGLAAVLLVTVVSACKDAPSPATGAYQRAEALLLAGKPGDARRMLLRAVAADPDHAASHIALGGLAVLADDLGAAWRHYASAIQADETVVEAHYRLGQLSYKASKVGAALQHVTNAYRLAPDDPRVLALKSKVAAEIGNDRTALRSAARAVMLAPTSGEARIALTAITLRMQGPEAALGVLEALPEPKGADFFAYRTGLLHRLGRLDDVRTLREKRRQTHPADLASRQALVDLLLEAGAFDAARAEAAALARAAPGAYRIVRGFAMQVLAADGVEAARTALATLGRETGTGDLLTHKVLDAELAIVAGVEAHPLAALSTLALHQGAGGETAKIWAAAVRLAAAAGDGAAAGDALDALAATQSASADMLIEATETALEAGEPEAAAAALARLEAGRTGTDPHLAVLRARASAAMGRPDRAEEILVALLQHGHTVGEVATVYAGFAASHGTSDRARRALTDVLAHGAEPAPILDALARLALAEGDLDRAVGLVRQCAREANDPARISRLAAQTAAALTARGGSGTGAAATFADLVSDLAAEHPAEIELQILAARLAGTVGGNAPDAEARLLELVARHPASEAAHLALAVALHDAGRQDGMLRALDDGLARASTRTRLRMFRADALMRRGRYAEALADYEILYRQDPSDARIANNLAALLLDLHSDPETTARALEIARRFAGSEVPHFLDTFGWALVRSGHAEEALAPLSAAAAALADNAGTMYHLAVAYAEIGQSEQAREVFARARRLDSEGNLRYAALIDQAIARYNSRGLSD